ncbi:Cro/CI family transcriptional regulator [Methylococcus mesophilus]|uniref:Cro/CI family transcriptional regulator n=1 Tax=Methylococcus mesophilus TaxID=2993564 RepID=UPI00224B0EAE|nr:Cro/CI family transcriptional regulator [Methylococcus mesophilus]UZR29058.1 Cro/CI family transcriptional regulator [Methylococcus mesophilus]
MNKTDVIRHFGSGSKVAEALGISRMAVSSWPSLIPLLRAYQIERLSKGALRVDESLYDKKGLSEDQAA